MGQSKLKEMAKEIDLNQLREHVITRKEALNAELIEASAHPFKSVLFVLMFQ